jgi:hypothetical protein
VRRVLTEHAAGAEDVLVALVDAMVDSYVDAELRERGLGPEGIGRQFADAMNAVQAAVYEAEPRFGKGFGRQPARGTAEDVRRQAEMWQAGRQDGLTPLQRMLRHVMAVGWTAAEQFLDRVDPVEEEHASIEG